MIWGSEEQLIGSRERQSIGKKLDGRPGGWQRRCRHLLDYFGLSGCGVQLHVGPLVRCTCSLTGGDRRLFDLEAGQKLTAKDRKQLCWLEKALLWQIEDKAAALIGPYSCGLVRSRNFEEESQPAILGLFQDGLGPVLVCSIIQQLRHALRPRLDTAGDNGDEVGLVRVELVQFGQEKLPLGLDDDLVSEELLKAL
jgi:hypothetical protein